MTQGIYYPEKKIKANLYINQFFKPRDGCLKPGNGLQYTALVDIKSSPVKFIDGDEICPGKNGVVTIQFEKLFYHDGSGIKGIITDLNKFDNKLRIVGYFSQILD